MADWTIDTGSYVAGFTNVDVPTLVVMERHPDGSFEVVADIDGPEAEAVAGMLAGWQRYRKHAESVVRGADSLRAEVERLRAGIQRVVTECKVACSGACMSDPAWNAYDDCKDMLEALLK